MVTGLQRRIKLTLSISSWQEFFKMEILRRPLYCSIHQNKPVTKDFRGWWSYPSLFKVKLTLKRRERSGGREGEGSFVLPNHLRRRALLNVCQMYSTRRLGKRLKLLFMKLNLSYSISFAL